MKRYVVVVACPFKSHTGTTSFTSMNSMLFTDDLDEANEKVEELFDEYAGMVIVIDCEAEKVL